MKIQADVFFNALRSEFTLTPFDTIESCLNSILHRKKFSLRFFLYEVKTEFELTLSAYCPYERTNEAIASFFWKTTSGHVVDISLMRRGQSLDTRWFVTSVELGIDASCHFYPTIREIVKTLDNLSVPSS